MQERNLSLELSEARDPDRIVRRCPRRRGRAPAGRRGTNSSLDCDLRVPRRAAAGAAALDVSFRIDLSQPAPRAAGWVPAHPPTRALTQPTLRPLAEQQPALTLAG